MTRFGFWTQNAQILCPDCAHKIGKGMQQQMMYSTSIAICEYCHREILITPELAAEQKLVYEARRAGYVESWMSQTGGMCHAAEILFEDFDGHKWFCSCTYHIDSGEYWWIETYSEQQELVSEREANSNYEVLDNIYWMQRNCCAIPSAS